MKHKLSGNMSPKAKKTFLRSASEGRVASLLQMASNADEMRLRQGVENLGGKVRAWQPEMGTATADIDANRLAELAELDGVVYVEVGESYQA